MNHCLSGLLGTRQDLLKSEQQPCDGPLWAFNSVRVQPVGTTLGVTKIYIRTRHIYIHTTSPRRYLPVTGKWGESVVGEGGITGHRHHFQNIGFGIKLSEPIQVRSGLVGAAVPGETTGHLLL